MRHDTRLLRKLLLCLIPILLANVAHAQVQIFAYFKKTDGSYVQGPIDGQDIGEGGGGLTAFEIQSAAFSGENAATIGTGSGGAGAGTFKFGSMEFTKLVDKATPTIFNFMTTGQHLDTLVLVFRKTVNGQPVTFLRVGFRLAFFVSTSTAASSGDSDLSEVVKVAYGAQQVTYYPVTSGGVQGSPTTLSWSQVKNNATFEVE